MNELNMTKAEIDAAIKHQLFGTESVAETVVESASAEALETTKDTDIEPQDTTQTEEETTVESEVSEKHDEESTDKKLEKDAKKRYLSEISRMKKEIEELKKSSKSQAEAKYDSASLEVIDKIVDNRFKEKEMEMLEKAEKNAFLNNYPELKNEISEIEEIRNDFPNMSYDAARKLYLAEKDPSALVGIPTQKSPTSLGALPNSIQHPTVSQDELKRLAEEEYWQMAKGY